MDLDRCIDNRLGDRVLAFLTSQMFSLRGPRGSA